MSTLTPLRLSRPDSTTQQHQKANPQRPSPITTKAMGYDPADAAAAIVTAHKKARGELHDDGLDQHSDAGRNAAAILAAHEKASGRSE